MPIVTLRTGRSFAADPTVSLLDAARVAGVVLDHGCRTGRCGACKTAAAGDTVPLCPEDAGLAPEETARGLILTCCRAAIGDLSLDVEPLDRLAGLELRTIPARIVSLDRLAPDIVRVTLRTPPATPLRFLPGQYVDVIARGVRRSYSIANAPRADGRLELIVRRYPGGVLGDYLFDQAETDDLVRIEGPFGTFFLRDDGPRDLLFLATGTGIAPVKALLEELAADPARAARHRLRVFWGNRAAESFCWDPVGLRLDVGVHHLLSGDVRGHVQDAALRDGVDPAGTAVYACGSPTMIAAARAALIAHGLPPARFLSDAFVSSS